MDWKTLPVAVNESKSWDLPGDITLYENIQKMLGNFEIIDVINQEYKIISFGGFELKPSVDRGQIVLSREKFPSKKNELRQWVTYFVDTVPAHSTRPAVLRDLRLASRLLSSVA